MILYSYPIRREDLSVVEKYGRDHNSPLIGVHSVGFYSYFQTHLPGPFPIVDTHPEETATADLRLLAPWTELSDFAGKMAGDIEKLDSHEHGHLPYIVVLLHYLGRWRETHGGIYPTTYKDKTVFRQMVSGAARRDNPEGGEENFDEAVAAVMKNLERPSLPSGLKEVFEYREKHPVSNGSLLCCSAESWASCLALVVCQRGADGSSRTSTLQASGLLRTPSGSFTIGTSVCQFQAASQT